MSCVWSRLRSIAQGFSSLTNQSIKTAHNKSIITATTIQYYYHPPNPVKPSPDPEPARARPTVTNSAESGPVGRLTSQPSQPDSDVPVMRARARQVLTQSSPVPSTKLGRLAHYTSLLGGLGMGIVKDKFTNSANHPGGGILSAANGRRLVDKLSRMRGAALKVGQFLSIQDSAVVPDQLRMILEQVQHSANFMPFDQTNKVLETNLGKDWPAKFESFELVPFAAASIGQVHQARLHPSAEFPSGLDVAVKVQFPGVRQSIQSDLTYLSWLLIGSSVLPKGLFLENTIKVMTKELDDECDYQREAEQAIKMRSLIQNCDLNSSFRVARVISDLSGAQVLTTELMAGQSLSGASEWDQAERDLIGNSVLNLCLSEVFRFGLMQTDPNTGNFLFDRQSQKLELIDFGATREYHQPFINTFYELLLAAVHQDKPLATRLSQEVGYLTGNEVDIMIDAHLNSLFALASPFRADAPEPFNFGQLGPPITDQIRKQIPVMLQNRLTPPPDQTYSLNRKLSGAFLLCERLKSNVQTKSLLQRYKPSHTPTPQQSSLINQLSG